MKDNVIVSHTEYRFDNKPSETFCMSVIDKYKSYLIGRKDIFPSFSGRTPDGIWGISFTKEIDTEEDMVEVIDMIKNFFIQDKAKEVLFLCRGQTIEYGKKQETLLCMLFDRSKSMKFKVIDIYRTEDKTIFGFSESDFSVCEILDMVDFGILKGSFNEN